MKKYKAEHTPTKREPFFQFHVDVAESGRK